MARLVRPLIIMGVTLITLRKKAIIKSPMSKSILNNSAVFLRPTASWTCDDFEVGCGDLPRGLFPFSFVRASRITALVIIYPPVPGHNELGQPAPRPVTKPFCSELYLRTLSIEESNDAATKIGTEHYSFFEQLGPELSKADPIYRPPHLASRGN